MTDVAKNILMPWDEVGELQDLDIYIEKKIGYDKMEYLDVNLKGYIEIVLGDISNSIELYFEDMEKVAVG